VVTRIIQGRHISRRIHQAMIDLGVPRELLAAPGNGPGRPHKTQKARD
jgi:hypothetical protein